MGQDNGIQGDHPWHFQQGIVSLIVTGVVPCWSRRLSLQQLEPGQRALGIET